MKTNVIKKGKVIALTLTRISFNTFCCCLLDSYCNMTSRFWLLKLKQKTEKNRKLEGIVYKRNHFNINASGKIKMTYKIAQNKIKYTRGFKYQKNYFLYDLISPEFSLLTFFLLIDIVRIILK